MAGSEISVVICTRNRPEAIRDCLASLSLSTAPPLEIIVVDQSDDGLTAEVVRDCSAAMPVPLRHLRMDTVGHSRARNFGIQASRGQVVAFTDDDCTVSPGWIESLSREFSDAGISCVCGQTQPANHGSRPTVALLSTLKHRRHRLLRGKRNPITVGRGNNFAFRKADLQRLGGFDERIGVGTGLYAGDDMELLYRLLEGRGTVACAPEAIVLHRQPDDWASVVRKKRGYSIASAAVLASRLRSGDLYAGLLLIGKMAYELVYLLCGGIIRANRMQTSIGWHSIIGSLSGLKYLADTDFCGGARLLSMLARRSGAGEIEPEAAAPGPALADSPSGRSWDGSE